MVRFLLVLVAAGIAAALELPGLKERQGSRTFWSVVALLAIGGSLGVLAVSDLELPSAARLLIMALEPLGSALFGP